MKAGFCASITLGSKNKNAKICVFELKPVETHRQAKKPREERSRRPLSRNRWRTRDAGGPSHKVEKGGGYVV